MKNILLGLLIVSTLSIYAQKKSEWKLFNATYVFDEGDYKAMSEFKNKITTNEYNDVAVAENGDVYFATTQGLYIYSDKKLTKIKLEKAFVNNVYSIEFDSQENLWIGAYGYLAKYKDGIISALYTKDTHPNMAIARALEIVIDEKDNVWITGRKDLATKQGAGISMFDGSVWTNYQEIFEKPFVEELTIDANGNVWVVHGRQDDGVAMFDGGEWQFFNKSNTALKTNIIRAIASDENGKVYFGTEEGLTTYNEGEWENVSLTDVFKSKFLTKFAAMGQPKIVSLAVDQNEVLWIGTKTQGVLRLFNDAKTEISIDNSPMTSNAVKRIFIDRNNAKWFITGFRSENISDELSDGVKESSHSASFKGVVMYSEPNYNSDPQWEVHNYYTQDIPASSYSEVAKDADQNIWLTTSKGLLMYDQKTWQLKNDYTTVDAASSQLSTGLNTSVGLEIDEDNSIWIEAKSLMKIKGEEVQVWNKKENDLGKIITGMAIDLEGDLWFGNNNGLCSFDGTTFDCIDKKEGLPDVRINQVFIDSKNNKWVGFYSSVGLFDGSTWQEFNKKNGGMMGTYPVAFLERSNGEMWIGSMKGIGKSTDNTNWEMFSCPKELSPYLQVKCMAEDADGNIFIGTSSSGLFVYTKDNEWHRYSSENSGLPHDEINDIIVGDGGLWVVSSIGDVYKAPTFPSYNTTTDALEKDPSVDINKKIDDFDPESAISFFKF